MESGWISLFNAGIVICGTGALLPACYALWAAYGKKRTLRRGMALAVLPSALFLLWGVTLRHGALIVCAVLFACAHCRVTYLTHKDL